MGNRLRGRLATTWAAVAMFVGQSQAWLRLADQAGKATPGGQAAAGAAAIGAGAFAAKSCGSVALKGGVVAGEAAVAGAGARALEVGAVRLGTGAAGAELSQVGRAAAGGLGREAGLTVHAPVGSLGDDGLAALARQGGATGGRLGDDGLAALAHPGSGTGGRLGDNGLAALAHPGAGAGTMGSGEARGAGGLASFVDDGAAAGRSPSLQPPPTLATVAGEEGPGGRLAGSVASDDGERAAEAGLRGGSEGAGASSSARSAAVRRWRQATSTAQRLTARVRVAARRGAIRVVRGAESPRCPIDDAADAVGDLLQAASDAGDGGDLDEDEVAAALASQHLHQRFDYTVVAETGIVLLRFGASCVAHADVRAILR